QAMPIWSGGIAQFVAAKRFQDDYLLSPPRVAFSPDGRQLAASFSWVGMQSRVCVWDLTTGKTLRSPVGYTDRCDWVMFNPDGKRIIACVSNGRIIVSDAESGKEVSFLQCGGSLTAVRGLTVSSDGQRMAFHTSNYRSAHIWDAETEKPLLSESLNRIETSRNNSLSA